MQGKNNLKPIAQLPRGLTLNNVVPTIVPGGTSILAAAAAQANIPTTPTTPTIAPVSIQSSTVTTINKFINTTMTNSVNSVSLTTALSTPTCVTTSGEQISQHHAASVATTPAAGVANATSMVPAGVTTQAATVTLANMKPITQIPIQLFSPVTAQMATLQQLVNQAVNLPRGSAPVTVTGNNPTTPTATVPASPNVHPATPVLSPLILSPQVLTQSSLAQMSAANIVSSPLLKTIGQIPIIQQPLTLSPAGLVKPLVMVTMPSVAATTSAPAAAVATPAVPVSNSS